MKTTNKPNSKLMKLKRVQKRAKRENASIEEKIHSTNQISIANRENYFTTEKIKITKTQKQKNQPQMAHIEN